MGVTIRPLQAGDRTQWDPLWQGYLTFYKTQLPSDVTEETWRRLIEPGRDPKGFCAVEDSGRLVGIVHYLFHLSTWTKPDICYLQDLFVDPAVRGGGIGRKLIEVVYAEADRRGAANVYWLTQDFNETARKLYDKVAKVTPFIRYRRT